MTFLKNRILKLPKNVLDSEFCFPNWNAVHKLQGAPKPVEFRTLVDIHNSIGRRRTNPNWIVQKASQSAKNHFEDGQTATQSFPRQQVPFSSDHGLLQIPKKR